MRSIGRQAAPNHALRRCRPLAPPPSLPPPLLLKGYSPLLFSAARIACTCLSQALRAGGGVAGWAERQLGIGRAYPVVPRPNPQYGQRAAVSGWLSSGGTMTNRPPVALVLAQDPPEGLPPLAVDHAPAEHGGGRGSVWQRGGVSGGGVAGLLIPCAHAFLADKLAARAERRRMHGIDALLALGLAEATSSPGTACAPRLNERRRRT